MRSSNVVILSILTLAVAAVLLVGCDRDTTARAQSVTTIDVPRVVCELCYDVSGSLDEEQFSVAKQQSKNGLEDFLQAFSCTAVRGYTFADGFVPSEEWAVTHLRTTVDDRTALDPTIDHLKEAQKLKDERRRDTTQQAERALRAARASIIASAHTWIDTHAVSAAPARCTVIRPFIQMTQEQRINPAAVTVIYTDGDDGGVGCEAATTPMRPRHALVFIVIPQKVTKAAMAPSAAAAAARLERLYPGAVAIPYFEVADPRLWSTIRGRLAGGQQ